MKLSSFRYVIPESLRSIRRNLLMTVAAVATVAISLFLCSIFMLLVINLDTNATEAISELEIRAYLEEDVSAVDRVRIEYAIKALEGVAADGVTFVGKEDALAQLDASRFSGVFAIFSGDANPLPDMFSVMAVEPELVPALNEKVAQIAGIYDTRYGEGITETLLAFTDTLRKAGIAVMILLGLAAIVLIAMGTRISVYSRQKEIMVMKWIGSTNAFIRWPFLLEGVMIGLVGSILGLLLCFLLYNQMIGYIEVTLPFMFFMSAGSAIFYIGPTVLLAGIIMGGLGSAVSVARFLDV